MKERVTRNLVRIRKEIEAACNKSGANPKHVAIVGVTKYYDYRAIVDAVQAGVKHIGENRPLEVIEKFPDSDSSILGSLGPGKHYTKHMIGHLQRNKVKHTLGIFDVIQSLDSISLAEEIQKQAEKKSILKVDCFIELMVSEEESKSGFDPSSVGSFTDALLGLDRINIIGLMGMAPYFENPEETRPYFRQLRKTYVGLESRINERFNLKYLSMGMSNDFRIAVEEGANMIRIGQALFE